MASTTTTFQLPNLAYMLNGQWTINPEPAKEYSPPASLPIMIPSKKPYYTGSNLTENQKIFNELPALPTFPPVY